MDKERLQAAVREILLAVGEDPDRPGLVETPAEWRICTPRCLPDWKRTRVST